VFYGSQNIVNTMFYVGVVRPRQSRWRERGTPLRKTSLIPGALLALAIAATPASAALPDGRVYEQVSPVKKNGNESGAQTGYTAKYTFASPDGGAIVFGGGGPQGDGASGIQQYNRSRRTAGGWTTTSALPRPTGTSEFVTYYNMPRALLPADDLSTFVFWSQESWHPDAPPVDPNNLNTQKGLYRGSFPDPVEWISQPTVSDPVVTDSGGDTTEHYPRPAGGSPDLSRVYFSYLGTLLPEDEPRRPQALDQTAEGFYEYSNGTLKSAGVLPDGSVDPYGAVAAGTVMTFVQFTNVAYPDDFHNQVSADGRNALFVSPDPRSNSGRVPQLYVRKDGQSTALISKIEGSDAPAPNGPLGVLHPRGYPGGSESRSYAFGSRDGSRVFFQTVDKLTSDAPANDDVKTYRYEVATDDLSYLPGVSGTFLAGSDDGSRLFFLADSDTKLRVWDDGVVSDVASFGVGPEEGANVFATRTTRDGSVVVFQTPAPTAGFTNSFGLDQVYRYELATSDLECVSCPTSGGEPTSAASITGGSTDDVDGLMKGPRSISGDGEQVYFDTVDALSVLDVNGKRDVYRWEDGDTRLISSGKNIYGSFYLDNDESGEDVFFATQEGLLPLDRDGAYDVYDARVGGGFPDTTPTAPCAESCQGDAPAGPGLAPLASVTFDGSGNLRPAVTVSKVRLSRWKLKGGRLALSVRAPGKGRIVVGGARVRDLKRSVGRAGTYRLSVALTRSAKSQLRRTGKLAVRLRVRYVPASGSPSSAPLRLKLKR
jgi:hypothetical protein